MNNLSPIDPRNIKVLEFDEAQTAQISAALMLAAEGLSTEVKHNEEDLYPDEVVDLLSDSDEDTPPVAVENNDESSDCEILGYLTRDTGELLSGEEVLLPIKDEDNGHIVKEEQQEDGEVNALATLNSDSAILAPGDGASPNASLAAGMAVAQLYAAVPNSKIVDIVYTNEGGETQQNEFEPEAVFSSAATLPNVPIITSVTSVAQPLAGFASNTWGEEANLNIRYLAMPDYGYQEVETPANPTDDSETDVASEGSNSEVYQPDIYASNTNATKVANIFGTDKFEIDIAEETFNTCLDNDIIELEDSDGDDDIDHETEMKLIELIESDEEDNKQEGLNVNAVNSSRVQEPAVKTLDMLIHFFCPECDYPCGSIKKWRAHTDSKHDFRSINKLNIRTIVGRDGNLRHQCTDCLMKFVSIRPHYLLMRHRISHLPYPSYYKCRLCAERFRSRTAIRKHLVAQHSKICREYIGKNSVYSHIAFHCPICNAAKNNRKQLQKHLQEKHDYSAKLNETFLKSNDKHHKPFKCKLCEDYKSFNLRLCHAHVLRHLRIGGPTVNCLYCEVKFKNTPHRDAHMHEKHHTKMLKCDMCEMSFNRPSTLLLHMNKSNHQRLK